MTNSKEQKVDRLLTQASELNLQDLAKLSERLTHMLSKRQKAYTTQIKKAKVCLGTKTSTQTLSALEAIYEELGRDNARNK